MRIAIFLSCLCLLHYSDGARKLYTAFKHVKSGKYLSNSGQATVTSKSEISDKELFDLLDGENGQKILITAPFNMGKAHRFAMDVEKGCVQNSTVMSYKLTKEKNQRWFLNENGSIGSACQPNWLLTINDSGDQKVINKRYVPLEDREWKQSQHRPPKVKSGDDDRR